MNGDQIQNPIQLALVSSLPLLWTVASLKEAVFLGTAVVTSAAIFEALLWTTRRFWFKSLLPGVALVVIASVVAGILLVSRYALPLPDRTAATIPLALPAAFLFASAAISQRGSWGRRKLLSWVAFFILLLMVGALRQWGGPLQTFSPASFWIAALALAVSGWFKRGRTA